MVVYSDGQPYYVNVSNCTVASLPWKLTSACNSSFSCSTIESSESGLKTDEGTGSCTTASENRLLTFKSSASIYEIATDLLKDKDM